MLSQVYLCNSPFLQGSLNIFGCLMQFSFLVYYLPFNDNWILLSNICGELSITLTMILSFTFLFDISVDAQNLLEKAVMFIIIAGMAVQFLICLYLFGKSMHYVWQKAQKIRAEAFLANSTVRKTSNGVLN